MFNKNGVHDSAINRIQFSTVKQVSFVKLLTKFTIITLLIAMVLVNCIVVVMGAESSIISNGINHFGVDISNTAESDISSNPVCIECHNTNSQPSTNSLKINDLNLFSSLNTVHGVNNNVDSNYTAILQVGQALNQLGPFFNGGGTGWS